MDILDTYRDLVLALCQQRERIPLLSGPPLSQSNIILYIDLHTLIDTDRYGYIRYIPRSYWTPSPAVRARLESKQVNPPLSHSKYYIIYRFGYGYRYR